MVGLLIVCLVLYVLILVCRFWNLVFFFYVVVNLLGVLGVVFLKLGCMICLMGEVMEVRKLGVVWWVG